MKDYKEKILNRIKELTSIEGKKYLVTAEELFSGTLSITNILYGSNSVQLKYLLDMRDKISQSKYNENGRYQALVESTLGFLNNIESELKNDFIINLEKEISGELFSNFIILSKNAIEGNNKDVAAVLSCAAIEDSLKKLATINDLEVENKDMSEIINLLKSKSILGGTEGKLAQAFVKLRNKAFHAEWEKIDIPEVKSLIAFTEGFIFKYFSK